MGGMEGLMKLLICVLVLAFVRPSMAAQGTALDDFVPKIQEAYRKARTQKEIESVTAYCKEKVASFSFKERDALSVQAIKLLEEKKLEEANALLKQVNDLEELDENLGKLTCKRK
jgi:Fe2+ transport system protein B